MAKVTRLTLDSNAGTERRRLHLRDIAEAETPLDTVGQELRKARGRRNEEVSQIAGVLKIRKDHLEAIEDSRFEALPGKTYAIGFVRTYANYLGLDPAQCIERLKGEIAGKSENKDNAIPMSPPEERKLPQGWLIFAALLLVAGAYGGYYLVVSANHMANQTTTAPVPERLAAEAAAPVPSVKPAGATPAAPAPAGQPSAAVTLPVAPAANPPAAAPPPAAPQASATAADTLPEGAKYGQQNAGSRITLRVHRDVRVDVAGPDARVFLGRILKRGDTYRVPSVQGTVLTLPDAGAVEILVDGKSLGYMGKDGEAVENVTLSAREMIDRLGQAG